MKYICYYDIDDSEKRVYALSAKNKSDYVITSVENTGEENIDIVSVSMTRGKNFCRSRVNKISNHITLHLFSSFGQKNIITKFLDCVLMPIKLFFYLIFSTHRNERVIVYHSLSYCYTVLLAKKLKGFYLISEFEEMYSDVSGNKFHRKKELRFCEKVDAFILPTALLNDAVNSKSRPSIIVHGTYKVEPDCRKMIFADCKQSDDKKLIHCVYAGTLDPRKGGSAVVAAAEFLPDNYHLHILGFGTDQQINDMKFLIDTVLQKTKARVTYDGIKEGEEFSAFLQSCDIGLSPQDPDAKFNSTSFPSKILTYLSNGLRVVSIKIPAIEMSSVGDLLYYYEKQEPIQISNAILSVKLSDDSRCRERIKSLNDIFICQLSKILDHNENERIN